MEGHTVADDETGLTHRRAAITELGDALRTLIEHATTTEVPTGDLLRAASELRDVAARLGERVRGRATLSRADDLLGGVRMYNPVTGAGSALAPPLHVEVVAGTAIGRCTLGLAYEGPPTFAHGGVSAMLLDQILGHAVVASGNPGMTVRLDTAYHAPVPLLTPLLLTADVLDVSGRRVTATGTIATEAEPGTALVTATGTFVGLRAEQTRRLFGSVLRGRP
ncbi:PaaI family thioesterase [Actinoplanes regularis]|uniref:PaaI family thioesterase n=1 Tax=Actinoplanes regularis TaxID=52697 RepID=UPI0025539C39|nr:hotdog domain-containing protein [Actinoplanes regularis]